MNNLATKVFISSVLMGASLCGWTGACDPIAIACIDNGYYKQNGDLIKDCVLPVASGNKSLAKANFTPEQLQQCKALLDASKNPQP